MNIKQKTVKIFAAHPVQYQAPLWRQLAIEGWKIEVAYYHRGTAGRAALDVEFGIEIEWDVDMLGGYPCFFLNHGDVSFRLREQIACLWKVLIWAFSDREVPILFVGWFAELVWVLWFFAILLRQPHLMMGDTTNASFAATPKPRWRMALLQWLISKTTACLYVGKLNLAFLKSMGASDEHLFYTPHSVDVDRFANESSRLKNERDQHCRAHGLDPALPTFLFCGKLIPKKRPLQLLRAYLDADLKDRAQLIFVGDGALRSVLEEQIRSWNLANVRVIGFLNQSQVPLAYVLGNVLCLLSDSNETWGLVVNEAMVCGCPVIVSDEIGCARDLVDERNGWVIALDDEEALTRTLRLAFDRQHEWPLMATAAKEKISRYTFKAMIDGITQACDYMAKQT